MSKCETETAGLVVLKGLARVSQNATGPGESPRQPEGWLLHHMFFYNLLSRR